MTRQRDDLDSQLQTTKEDLADTVRKYNKANDRIRSLANEKAQVGDQAAFLAETVALSNQVTIELDACVNDLKQAIFTLARP
jgi:uncharacterized protein involved in exopolysaccharide biosynthesis